MRFGLREILFFAVLLGLPVAAYFFVFQPVNLQIDQVHRENATKQAKLDKLEVARHIENVGNEIKKLDQSIQLFEAKLPAEKETEVILREVWQLAAQHGLRPKSVRTDKSIQNTLYSELPIKMEILGDFDGFYSFLLDLEKLSRITRIPDLTLKKMRDTEGHMTATFTLSIFFEPRQAGHKDKDTPKA
ncbi:MAG: type 4a pilus biogenesis protein PilO [Phycisphaeraceae bacterium]